ncbi:lactonase family protein [Arthrobacter monumenti]
MSSVAVYVGCAAGKSIDTFELDLEKGVLSGHGRFQAEDEVQWLATGPDGSMLYAAVRSDPPSVISLQASGSTSSSASGSGSTSGSRLHQAGTAPLAASMAYLSPDHSGTHLLAASYNDDVVTVSSIGDGVATGARTALVIPGRHAHTVLPSPDNKYVYATALGDDLTAWWAFDPATGKLDDGGTIASEPGSGPRHLRFSNSGYHVYVLHEMAGTVTVFERDAATGLLTERQSVSSIPEHLQLIPGRVRDGSVPKPGPDAIWCAELRLTPDNRSLYTTERSSSTITAFGVDGGSGELTYLGSFPTEAQPRGMNITPDGQYLLACGEVSSRLSVYQIDQPTGALAFLDSYECAAGPRCIEFSPESA